MRPRQRTNSWTCSSSAWDPAGLVAGMTLAHYGVDVLVVEQREGGSNLSWALVISTRSMELLRRFGLEEAVRAGAADVEPTALATPTLAFSDGMVIPLGYPSDEEAARVSPTRPSWTPQAHHGNRSCWLTSKQHRRRRCGSVPSSSPSTRTRTAFEANVLDVASGHKQQVEARNAIAAEGAHSTVRTEIGIAMEGPDDLEVYEAVEFLAALDDAVG